MATLALRRLPQCASVTRALPARPATRLFSSVSPIAPARPFRGQRFLALGMGTGVVAGGVMGFQSNKTVHCQEVVRTPFEPIEPVPEAELRQPQSIVNVKELTFGTVAGICAGVFIKKGARALAFLLGAAFVFLQYLKSQGLIAVQWGEVSERYAGAVSKNFKDTAGKVSVESVWSKLVDFLTADFQQRATFIAGLALGLRIG